MYDGIIFDIDGTLWDSRKTVADSWNAAVRENTDYNICFDYKEIGKLFGKPMNEIFEILLPDIKKDEINKLIGLLYRYEDKYLAAYPPKAYDGTEEVLKYLCGKYKLYIVTNAQKGYTEALFNATGIGKYFTDYLCHGDTLSSKDVTLKILIDKNNIKNPVYIGDTQGDFDACEKACVPMIYAEYGLGEVRNSVISIKSISGLLDIL